MSDSGTKKGICHAEMWWLGLYLPCTRPRLVFQVRVSGRTIEHTAAFNTSSSMRYKTRCIPSCQTLLGRVDACHQMLYTFGMMSEFDEKKRELRFSTNPSRTSHAFA